MCTSIITVMLLLVNVISVQSAQKCMYNEWLLSECEVNTTNCNVTNAIGMCSTCDPESCTAYYGMCHHGWNQDMIIESSKGYILEVTSCEDLTNKTCGPLNREGILCNKCLPGFGPSPYVPSFSCFSCLDEYKVGLWLLYWSLELVPLMTFYLLVILFNIQFTSPPYTSYILFCQLFGHVLYSNTSINLYLRAYANKHLVDVVFTLLNIWNLDFLRFIVPPFCVSSSLSDKDVLILKLIPATFPCLFVLITYIGIELHARNFAPVVYLWKPFRILSKFRRSWDPKSSILASFTTFLMISFSRVQFIAYELYFPIHYTENDVEYQISLYNFKIKEKNDIKYIQKLFSTSYFLPIAIISVILYSPLVVIILYSTKKIQRLFSRTRFCIYNIISVLADAFQGHYKNGTNGTRDYRLAFICNFFVSIIYSVTLCLYNSRLEKPKEFASVMIFCLLIVSLFYAIVQPCKKVYMNVTESLVYALGALVTLNLYSGFEFVLGIGVTGIIHSFVLYFTLFLISLPSLVFIGSVMMRITLFWKARTCDKGDVSKNGGDNLRTESNDFIDHVHRRMEYIPLP